MRKLPTILHEHANLTDTPWFQKVADRLLEPSTDLAIAVSKSTAEFVEHARLVRPEKIKVVYLGAPLEEFGRAAKRRTSSARRAPPSALRPTTSPSAPSRGCTTRRATSTSSRRPRRSSPRTRGRGSTWRGRARCASRWRPRRSALGLGDRFVFLGFQKDVAQTLSAFDLSVFPSLWEGTPLTAFETLAMGKAIVATDADGLLDILERDVTAWIVPRRDATALAGAIGHALEHPDERAAMAARARQAGRAVRHRGVRAQDGAALHAAPRQSRARRAGGAS